MYSYAPYYAFLRVLGCTCFVFYPFVECSKSSFHSIICDFLRYGEGKKRYCCIDPVSHKLYVSCHVFILEHIPFFYILVMFHNVFNNSKLVHIDPLLDDIDSFPTNTSTLVPKHHTSFLLLWLLQLLLRLWIIFPHILLSILVSLLNYQILFILLI